MRDAGLLLLALAWIAGCERRKADEAGGKASEVHPEVAALEKLPRAEVIAKDIQSPIGLALDDRFVYWGDGGALRRAPKKGGVVAEVCRVEAARIESIAVAAGAVYFGGMGGGVFRWRSLPGAPCERIATGSNPTSFAVSGDRLWYWNGAVHSVALDAPGTAPAPTMWQAGYTGALVVDADHLYVHDGRMIYREPKTSAERVVLARTGHLGVAMAIDDTHLYWGDDLVGGVLRVAKAGGPLEWVTSVWSIGATVALDGEWLFVVDIDAHVHAVSKVDGRWAQIAWGDFTGIGTNNVSVAFDRESFFLADDCSRNKVGGIQVIDLSKPDAELPEVVWEGAVARVARTLDGVTFKPRPAAVEANNVFFSPGSDQAQDWNNATHFTRWRDPRFTEKVTAGGVPVQLVAGVPDGDEAGARRRAEGVAKRIRDELGPKVVVEISLRQSGDANVSVQFAPAAYAAVWAP